MVAALYVNLSAESAEPSPQIESRRCHGHDGAISRIGGRYKLRAPRPVHVFLLLFQRCPTFSHRAGDEAVHRRQLP